MWIYRTGAAQPKCSRSRGRGARGRGGREAAGGKQAAGTPARASAGRGAPPSPVALITFVLVLREGETSARPSRGARGRHRPGRLGDGGGGRGRPGRGAVSFGSEADQ